MAGGPGLIVLFSSSRSRTPDPVLLPNVEDSEGVLIPQERRGKEVTASAGDVELKTMVRHPRFMTSICTITPAGSDLEQGWRARNAERSAIAGSVLAALRTAPSGCFGVVWAPSAALPSHIVRKHWNRKRPTKIKPRLASRLTQGRAWGNPVRFPCSQHIPMSLPTLVAAISVTGMTLTPNTDRPDIHLKPARVEFRGCGSSIFAGASQRLIGGIRDMHWTVASMAATLPRKEVYERPSTCRNARCLKIDASVRHLVAFVTAAPGFALLDAWEMAGSGSGHTWARGNPWAEL
jgi:hypothetical protein